MPAGYQAALVLHAGVRAHDARLLRRACCWPARDGGEADELDDYKGLAARDPWLALLMLVLMFSTAGVPPFVGFWAKLWIIQALLAPATTLAGHCSRWLAVGDRRVLLPARGLVHVFRAGRAQALISRQPVVRGTLALNVLAVLAIGIMPNALLALCTSLIGQG